MIAKSVTAMIYVLENIKLMSILFFVLFWLCEPCLAADYIGQYPKYLNDDENYIICDGHMGTAWYVDLSSIEVEHETDDDRILSVTVISATYNDHQDNQPFGVDDIRDTKSKQYEFLYDFNEKKIYIANGQHKNHFLYIERYGTTWRYIDPKGCWADVGIIKYAAIEAYRSEYGMEFYTN